MKQRILLTLAGVSTLPSTAMAQDLSPVTNMLNTVATALTGPIAVAVGTIAIVGVGFACLMGRLAWQWFIATFIGLVLIFGASSIVAGFA